MQDGVDVVAGISEVRTLVEGAAHHTLILFYPQPGKCEDSQRVEEQMCNVPMLVVVARLQLPLHICSSTL